MEAGASKRRRGGSHTRRQPAVLFWIGIAGLAGTLSRYGISRLLPTVTGRFPWGTFSVNVAGSLCLGFVLVLLTERLGSTGLARPIIATGFLGAFTTFSTFTVETDMLWRNGDVALGFEYAGASVLAGCAATVLGIVVARALFDPDRRLTRKLAR